MKIAILADVHANLIGLQTVADHIGQWRPDFVAVAGDTVNRGPRPRQCLEFVLDKVVQQDWRVIIGNHEEYVIARNKPDDPKTGLRYELFQATYWTCEQLNHNVAPLEAMPYTTSLHGPDDSEVRIVHGSMLGTRSGLFPWTTEAEIRKRISPPPPVICVGHTHRPFVKQIDDTLIVNAGSAGLSFDHDRRIGYAQLTWQHGRWQARIIRMDYDYHAAEQDFYDSGYWPNGGSLVKLVLNELHDADSRLASWSGQYEKQILAGEISMTESVDRFLRGLQ
ncbi:metallophosphoesterase family protein [Anaerolineales bacterium HSG24]|nr:metallophosphoesterase family protein [Anaerolineales bacterium HSG24]